VNTSRHGQRNAPVRDVDRFRGPSLDRGEYDYLWRKRNW
jgi:hypothetical protein